MGVDARRDRLLRRVPWALGGASHRFFPILVLRSILFRSELGAGLIKLRHDPGWRESTCLFYHYETQPLPGPLSRAFHRLPKPLHKLSVVFSHFVQLVVPFGLFAPQPVAAFAAGFVVVHQLLLIVSGNYSWLNWLTVVLAVTASSDAVLRVALPIAPGVLVPRSAVHETLLHALVGGVLVLSVQPTLNFFSKNQLMNHSYNPLHLVNAYGAFGRVTRERHEVILEGTDAETLGATTEWKEYELKAKPGRVTRRPTQVAPYHLRLDWMMWFLPFSARVSRDALLSARPPRWFLRLVGKLLKGDPATLALFGHNPFPDRPPRFVRARLYRYRFATKEEQRDTRAYWDRALLGDYLPAIKASEVSELE